MRRLALGLLLCVLCGLAFPTRADPVLDVRTRVDLGNPWLHQQVVLEVSVVHRLYARPRWEPPVCEGFWVERMPSEGGALLHSEDRQAARTTVFRRALFPTRVGALEIPASTLTVKNTQDEEIEVAVPGARVDVRALPEAGRPEGFSGLIGPFELRAVADEEEIALGRSLRVEVDVYGSGNVWDTRAPDLAASIAQPVEVFAERARTVTNTRKGRMMARRVFRFDVVPRERGDHTIASFGIDYFDPARGEYARATTEPIQFVVARAADLPQRAPWEVKQRAGQVELDRRVLLPSLALLVGLLALCGWGLARWWWGEQQAWRREPEPDPAVLLRRAEDALGTDAFPGLLAAAVRAGVRTRHSVDPAPWTTSELAARIRDDEAVRILRALDDARFARATTDATELLVATRRYLS